MLSSKYITKNEIKELYKKRWNIELDFRNIKTTLGMESLSCKTPEMAIKEMWVYFLAYNLIRIIMAQAASLSSILPRQLSFRHTQQLWRSFQWQSKLFSDNEILSAFMTLVAAKQVGNRPGRIEPRAVKKRSKPYPRLTKPRVEAREEVIKNGHPKKL